MFTIKLIAEGRTRLVEAASVTVYRYENGAAQITAHAKDEEATEGRAYYVGNPPHAVPNEPYSYFDTAFIENAAGKTTERIYTTPGVVAAA